MLTLIIVLLLQLCYSPEMTLQEYGTEWHMGNIDESIGLITYDGHYWEIGVNQKGQNSWLLGHSTGEGISEEIKSEEEKRGIYYTFKKVKTDKHFYKDNERFNRIVNTYEVSQFRKHIKLDSTIQMIESGDKIIVKDTHENSELELVLTSCTTQVKEVNKNGTMIITLDFCEKIWDWDINGRVRSGKL